jgi:ribosomal protein L2
VARHRMPDIKSYENIIKLKMIPLNSIINNMEINYWDRGKKVLRSNPEGAVAARDKCQGRLTKTQQKVP